MALESPDSQDSNMLNAGSAQFTLSCPHNQNHNHLQNDDEGNDDHDEDEDDDLVTEAAVSQSPRGDTALN